jgi:NarL family two-component system response regulator LiaR
MHPKKTTKTIGVGIVETDDVRLRYESALINGSPGMHTVWACATGKEAIESFAQCCPRVVLVSFFLKDMPGTELVRKIRREWPEVLPILFIPESQSRRTMEALEAGACGYLPAPCPPDELIRAIWTVNGGGAILVQPVAKIVVDYFRARGTVINRLTEREREILICLSGGLSQPEVVIKCGISKETVRTHVRNVLGKLGARSSTEAIALYLNPKIRDLADDGDSAGAVKTHRSLPNKTGGASSNALNDTAAHRSLHSRVK